MLSPVEICNKLFEVAKKKASLRVENMIMLGFLAGALIAFAAQGSTLVASDVPYFGLSKLVTGVVFAVGLMMVVLTGAELFTGNSLMSLGLFSGTITFGQLLRNWIFVYLGNFLGSVTMAWFMSLSGLWNLNAGTVGQAAIKIALAKVSMTFSQALVRGILCNWLVCLAVFMATGAGDAPGKILSIFFPIMLFVASGFEHSIANMYYVPAGIFAAAQGSFQGVANVATLTWSSFLSKNLLPTTLGNIIGGVVFVGFAYWFSLCRRS